MATPQSGSSSRVEALSPASQHGLALTALQGFQPGDWFIAILEALDAGVIDEAEARRQVEARLALRT